MAILNSPGVSVQVIDESFYTAGAAGTIPMVFVASAQDKKNPSGTTALGTTAANAGKVWLMTSQRDLTDTFGTPIFYTDASNNPQHANELNEYGLQAVYSLLGISSRAYVVRGDLDTSMLVPSGTIPKGKPVGGTYWVDTNAGVYGIKEWNNTTKKFKVITPLVINDDTDVNLKDGSAPAAGFGKNGDYCMVITKDNENQLWKRSNGGWTTAIPNQISTHYDYPDTSTWTSGYIWITTTTPTNGAKWSVKRYNSGTQGWDTVTAPLYASIPAATKAIDPTGGLNIAQGSLFIETSYDVYPEASSFKLWRRAHKGVTSVVSQASSGLSVEPTYSLQIREAIDGVWNSWTSITFAGNGTDTVGKLLADAVNDQSFAYVTASYNSTTKKTTITHNLGGEFEINDATASPFGDAGFVVYDAVAKTGCDNLYTPPAKDTTADYLATNWKSLVYEAKDDAPYTTPANGQLWCSSVHDEVDILIHNGTTWVGYASEYADTDPLGPIVAAVEPIEQSGGGDLKTGDIWISTADMEKYGKNIYVYDESIMSGSKWVAQDTTDQTTPNGWLFADVRWSDNGEDDFEHLTSIESLLVSDYLDPDAPDPAIYPKGMRLWNTRRSGNNVKKFVSGYIDITANEGMNPRYPHVGDGDDMSMYNKDRWVSQNNVAEDGSGVFGRFAQRAQVVAALKATIDTNSIIRDTDTVVFNLIAAPGYPEAIQNMVGFNTDRGVTAFVVGDTPFRLHPTGTELSNWGKNTALALDNNDTGAVSYDEYMAMYYPSGYTNDNNGNYIVVPPSHMVLRTIINSDNKSYVWFAPAGTRRGGVDNATSVGYITSEGEFKTAALHQSLRDVLQDPKVAINPIATLPGVGLTVYGQRTRARNSSSLDRVNVARLVCYLRRQLDILARPFLFEPNDAQTRREIKAAAESLLLELSGQRALHDYIVVCDETNNTNARIDRNELYMDIAIEPVKAVEFIYIPLRLKNTGAIKAGL